MRPIAERHGLTPLQLACHWNLAHGPVHVVAPTLIEEPGSSKSIEDKRAELAAVGPESVLSAEEVAELRAIGDNTGSMLLKGATPDFEGSEPLPDRWAVVHAIGRAGRPVGHRTRPGPDQSAAQGRRARVDDLGEMIRLNSIGAAVFALATLALPTFALTHSAPEKLTHLDTRGQLQDVNLAEVVATAQAAADDGDGIPTAWCGEDRTTDNTANAVFPASKAQFKVVYAFAADRPNRFAGWRDAIQANTAIVQRFLSAQGGGTKAIRFDMGTSCGPQYVDIQIVPLPGPRSSYADNFSAISSAVNRALGATSTPRNAIVIADGLAGGTQEYGLGETIMGASGEKSGATNVHNRGGLTSILFSRDGAAAPGASRWGWWPEGFLHEMTHNLGAVQWGAPHSTQPRGGSAPNYGHCWQGADVMCYVEDAGAAHAMQIDCAGLPGAIPQNYDCGRDDYFNPAPGAGQLPGDALEHVRLGVPGAVRRDRPGLRRRRELGPAGPGRDVPADGQRRPAPRLEAHGRRRRLDQHARRATPTSGSASPRPAGRTSTPRPATAT